MKKILVPTDFSANAGKALEFGIKIAKRASAELVLMNSCNMVDTLVREKTVLEKKYNTAQEEATDLELAALKEDIEINHRIKVSTVVYGGPVISSIIHAVEETKADLLVMGTLGNSGIKEKVVGSITSAVIGKINIPLLAVPLMSEWTEPDKILMAINDFEQEIDAARPVFELAGLFNSKVLATVYANENVDVVKDYVENEWGLSDYTDRLKAKYSYTIIEAQELYGKKFKKAVESYIHENGVDILAMFTHKRNFVEEIFRKSVTRKMSYSTNIPMLAIPV